MRIGTEEFNIQPTSKKAMDIWLIILNVLLYTVVFVWAFGYLSWPVFYLLFHLVYMRIFMGNHERFHSRKPENWPRPIQVFSEYFALVVTPWDEPPDSIRKKHFTHHATHRPGKTPGSDMLQDPHSIYEAGGAWRSLFFSLFFEEAQLYIDIRNKDITKSRWIRLAIYLPLQILFIMVFGWEKYLGVFLAVKLMSAVAWWLFSWFSHTVTYRFGFVQEKPWSGLFLFIWGLINGRWVSDGFLRHAIHHAWPSVPPGKLYILDEAVMRNPDAKPEMIPTPS
jgi:fatty acid desaturase